MREFFRGLRRKVGCVTLVMACAFMGMWIRSDFMTDIVTTNACGDLHILQSGHGVVSWVRQVGVGSIVHGWCTYDSIDHQQPSLKFTKWSEAWEPVSGWRCCWQYRIGDLGLGCHEQIDRGKLRTLWWRAAYWELVLPLTLLSAYLILWKPRKRREANA